MCRDGEGEGDAAGLEVVLEVQHLESSSSAVKSKLPSKLRASCINLLLRLVVGSEYFAS